MLTEVINKDGQYKTISRSGETNTAITREGQKFRVEISGKNKKTEEYTIKAGVPNDRIEDFEVAFDVKDDGKKVTKAVAQLKTGGLYTIEIDCATGKETHYEV